MPVCIGAPPWLSRDSDCLTPGVHEKLWSPVTTRRIVPRQHVGEFVEALPLRHGRRVAGARHVRRGLDHRHAVDVARAIGEDTFGADAHYELRADEAGTQRAVAVVARERELRFAGHAYEAGRPALVRAVGPPLAVGSGEEEQRAAFDERAVLVAEGLALQFLLESVGEAARVEAVLQLAP